MTRPQKLSYSNARKSELPGGCSKFWGRKIWFKRTLCVCLWKGGEDPLEVATQCIRRRGTFLNSNTASRDGPTQKPPCHTVVDVKWFPGCIMVQEQKSCSEYLADLYDCRQAMPAQSIRLKTPAPIAGHCSLTVNSSDAWGQKHDDAWSYVNQNLEDIEAL